MLGYDFPFLGQFAAYLIDTPLKDAPSIALGIGIIVLSRILVFVVDGPVDSLESCEIRE